MKISIILDSIKVNVGLSLFESQYAEFECIHKAAICTALLMPGGLSLFGAIAFVRIGEINCGYCHCLFSMCIQADGSTWKCKSVFTWGMLCTDLKKKISTMQDPDPESASGYVTEEVPANCWNYILCTSHKYIYSKCKVLHRFKETIGLADFPFHTVWV